MPSSSLTSAPENAHVGRLAEQAVARQGDYSSILFEGRWHSSVEMLERSCAIASGLVKLGLEPGDRVVVSMQNAPEVPVVYNGIWRAGGVVTPVMFLLPETEIRHIVADAGARMVVTTAEFAGKIARAIVGLDHVERVICVESDVMESTVPLAELEDTPPSSVVERAPSDLAALLYTGGTTGRSKGVMLSHANLTFASRVMAEYEADFRVGRELMTLPLSHSFGLMATLGAMQRNEPKLWVLLRKFDGATAVELIEKHRLDELQAVPSMVQMLLAEPLEDFDLSSFRVLYTGGAPLPPEVFHEFRRRVPSASIFEGYGLTENATLLTGTPLGGERPGSVGTALEGVDIRVVDGDGRALNRGDVGEICTRSAAVMLGYWNAPDQTAAALQDGWLATGDVGYVDDDGYVYILDRKKDLIIRGGFNVYPRDVEDALLGHPAVRMASVIGRPDAAHGEEVVAFVTLEPGATLTAEDLVAWSREQIGGYKYPREMHLLESLPLTDVGKIDRKALRARLKG
jgi:long-chain acyl-CoA synthetase